MLHTSVRQTPAVVACWFGDVMLLCVSCELSMVRVPALSLYSRGFL